VARSKYKIQEESEPRARQEKERITSPKKKKRRRKRAINERCAPVPWKVLIREHDARGVEQTNIFRESACTYTCTRTPTRACKYVYQPHVSRNSRTEGVQTFANSYGI